MPEGKRKKPGPTATGRTVKPVGVALSEEDVEYLQKLAYAVLMAEQQSAAAPQLMAGVRPSVSMAIRFLIDDYRRNHGGQAVATVKRQR